MVGHTCRGMSAYELINAINDMNGCIDITDQRRSFAYQHKVSVRTGAIDGWTIYNTEREYQRLGLAACNGVIIPEMEYGVPSSAISPSSNGHQIFRVIDNSNYTLSPTYPPLFVVPKVIGTHFIQHNIISPIPTSLLMLSLYYYHYHYVIGVFL
jgi:hypothetical protein